jgi:hypothetical protein
VPRPMKYIVVAGKSAGMTVEHMIVFPEELVHVMVFDALIRGGCFLLREPHVVAAGSITHNARCSGYSESLDVASRGEVDSTLYLIGGTK